MILGTSGSPANSMIPAASILLISTADFSLGSSKSPKRPTTVGVTTPLERLGNTIFSKLGHLEKNK